MLLPYLINPTSLLPSLSLLSSSLPTIDTTSYDGPSSEDPTNSTTTPENVDNVMDHVTPRVIFVIMYSVIFIVGVTGNSLVVFVVVRSPACTR